MLSLGNLVALVSLDVITLPLALSVPGWSQYVDLVKWALNSLAEIFQSGGLAIIVFTILIKTALMPLTVQSLRSAKAMQELQPKLKELQKKHGKDRQRLTQETMQLYSQHRVNPMAGCLPMLLQIPIFFGLYQAVVGLSNSDTGFWGDGQSFLWLTNGLDDPDPIFILPIAAGIFQFVQTRMMRPYKQGKITDPQQALMNQMMNFMPLTVIVFGWGFASGAVLYWATQSVFSVVQQWFITGWGSMRDWFDWLPEMPEHRRLGYRPPRPAEDPVVVSGDGASPPVRVGGMMGWAQRKMQETEQRSAARRGGLAGGSDTQARADAESRTTTGAGAAASTNGATRSRNGSRRGGASGGTRGARAKGRPAAAAGDGPAAHGDTQPNGQAEPADGLARGAVIVPRKARPERRPRTED